MISDNAATFKTTAKLIKAIRKSEKLHDFLAAQGIHWRFNLAKSSWWGGTYERLIREVKTGFVVSKTKKIQRLSKIFAAYFQRLFKDL
jgi:hypothetical protein